MPMPMSSGLMYGMRRIFKKLDLFEVRFTHSDVSSNPTRGMMRLYGCQMEFNVRIPEADRREILYRGCPRLRRGPGKVAAEQV